MFVFYTKKNNKNKKLGLFHFPNKRLRGTIELQDNFKKFYQRKSKKVQKIQMK